MIPKKLYGLKKYFLELIQLNDMGKLPKVLMLSGKKGQGKCTMVNHFMAYIFDFKNYQLKELTINNNNKLINGVKDNINSNIIYFKCNEKNVKIDDIRKLRLDLQKSSINKFNRFIIFDDVEHLSENCVNALLKTIEEPTETNHFILINNQSQILLDTLKSRSIEILVFLNNKEKLDIINKLILDYKIEKKIDLNELTLTPGDYLKYCKLISDEEIDIKDKLIINIEKLLKLSRTKKNIDYLNFAIYLTNQFYFTNSKNSQDIIYNNDARINIIKKLQLSNKLNLNHVNLISEIENYF